MEKEQSAQPLLFVEFIPGTDLRLAFLPELVQSPRQSLTQHPPEVNKS